MRKIILLLVLLANVGCTVSFKGKITTGWIKLSQEVVDETEAHSLDCKLVGKWIVRENGIAVLHLIERKLKLRGLSRTRCSNKLNHHGREWLKSHPSSNGYYPVVKAWQEGNHQHCLMVLSPVGG